MGQPLSFELKGQDRKFCKLKNPSMILNGLQDNGIQAMLVVLQ